MIFLDTCLIIYEIEQGNLRKLEEFSKKNDARITSFNLEELMHVEKKFGHLKRLIREAIRILPVHEIPVHPGDAEEEKKFVKQTSHDLLQKIKDPSDAVLIAAAINEKADVITRDKHHIFTTLLENELNKYGIRVFNSLNTYLAS